MAWPLVVNRHNKFPRKLRRLARVARFAWHFGPPHWHASSRLLNIPNGRSV